MSALANDVFALLSKDLPSSVSSAEELESIASSRGSDRVDERDALGAAIADWAVGMPASANAELTLVGRWVQSHASDGAMHLHVSSRLLELDTAAQVDPVRVLLAASPSLIEDLDKSGFDPWPEFLASARAGLSSADQDRLLENELRALVPSESYPVPVLPTLLERAQDFLANHPERKAALEAALREASPSSIAAASLAHMLVGAPAPAGPAVRAYFDRGFRPFLEQNLPPRIVPESHLGYEQWSAFQYAFGLAPFLRERFVDALDSLAHDERANPQLREDAAAALVTLR